MIDIMGIISMGSFNYEENSNGIFLFKDGSFGFGYKVDGFPFSTMIEEEQILVYQKLKSILNQLDYFHKGKGGVYQFISKKNTDFSKEKEIIRKNNYILYDKKYINKKTEEYVKPEILNQILNNNIEEFFQIMDNLELHKFDNYLFVKYKISLKEIEGVTLLDFLKNIFINDRNDREIEEINLHINNIISSHNSRLKEIDAKPLTLLEMINVVREHLGFSKLKKLPNLGNEDSYLRFLFPGKVKYQLDYIKTEEKLYINENNKYSLTKEQEQLYSLINEIKQRDLNYINTTNSKTKDMDNDLLLILNDILNISMNELENISLLEKYQILKDNIFYIYERLNDIYYQNFKYFTKQDFQVYKYEKSMEYKNIINNETYIKIFSVNELPDKLKIGWGQTLHTLSGDYSIVINFKKIDKNEAQIKMRRQVVIENIKISMPIMKWFMPIEVIQAKIVTLQTISQELEEAEFSRVDSLIYIVLRSNTPHDPREKDILGKYGTVTDMKWIKEKDAPDFHILKCSIPTSITANSMLLSKRTFFINSTNIAQLAPFVKEDSGADSYLLPMIGNNGLIGIDLNKAPAGHFSIQGATGGGKSVLANKIALNYKMKGFTVIVTEKGDSFARPALFFGGKIYKPDLSGKIKINPFVMTKNAFDENIENYEEIRVQNYIQMKSAMAQMCNNYNKDIQQIYFKILKKAFEEDNGTLNRKYVKNYAVTPTTLLGIMRIDPEFKNLKSELKSFEQFTKKGPYGLIFDGNEGLDLDYPYIQIDYSGISESDMKDFIFKSLLQNIFFEMSKQTANKSNFLNINDEFWDIINSGVATGDGNIAGTAMEQVAAFFRVARKLGGNIGVVSQSIQDVADSPLKTAIINNIYHTFFTNTKPADLKSVKELFGLSDEHLNDISNLTMEYGYYSEYFLGLAPYGTKLPGRTENRNLNTKFKYFPTSLEYSLFTTEPKERQIFYYVYNLLGISDTRELTTREVLKGVLFFKLFFPKGIYQNKEFMEILYANNNDVIAAVEDYVQQVVKIKLKKFLDNLSWKNYLS